MNAARLPSLTKLGAALIWALFATVASANVTSVTVSNVDAYFGSQSDANQVSNPAGFNPWPATGIGPYPGTATYIIPGLPAPLGSLTPSGVTPFGGLGSTSSFSDVPGNMATSTIVGFATPTLPNPIDDAQIALNMSLTQVGTPSSYAYEQLNYSIDYGLTNTPNSAGTLDGVVGSFVSRSFNVSGTVGTSPGSYAQFGGEMDFYSIIGGTPTALGTLTFSYINLVGGAFSTTVTGSGIIGPSLPVNNPDFIRVTGTFYVAGDPSSINVESVPEPTGLALMGAVATLLCFRRRRNGVAT